MHEIDIFPGGEVRHKDMSIGFVVWTSPFANLDGTGAWIRENEFELAPDCDYEEAIAEALDVLRSDAPDAARIKLAVEILEGCS